MKKITIFSNCVACGMCIVNSEFLVESHEGHAIPIEPGLITDEQFERFQTVVNECPVGAIQVEDELITSLGSTDAMITLKTMINDKIKNFKIPYPDRKEYDFDDKDYQAPTLITQALSKATFKSYDKAKDEGFSAFRNTMYSQQKALIQAVCIEYKARQLKRFAYYEEEKGNYYYDINMRISKMLEEAKVLGQAISGDKLVLPDDFSKIDIGPDRGFDGDLYCWWMRTLEQKDWSEKMKDAESYRVFVNVEECGDEYKYSLSEIESEFRQGIVDGLYFQLDDRVEEDIDKSCKEYSDLLKKAINEKLTLLKAELKRTVSFDDSDENVKENFYSDIVSLLDKTKSMSLKKENVCIRVDSSYDHSFRFSSYEKASQAAINRVDRFYDECSDCFDTNRGDRISKQLADKYKAQFEEIFNNFKTQLQEVYDKYTLEYPKISLDICCDDQLIKIDINDFDDIKSNIQRPIVDYIDRKVIGYAGAFKESDYFTYSDVDYDVDDITEWKKGTFGEKQVQTYCYFAKLSKCQNGFDEAIKFCCNYVYESSYMKDLIIGMMRSLEKQVYEKILNNSSFSKESNLQKDFSKVDSSETVDGSNEILSEHNKMGDVTTRVAASVAKLFK